MFKAQTEDKESLQAAKSLISIFFKGKIFFTSSDILSTPGPLKMISQCPSLEQFLIKEFLYPQ